MLPFASAEPSNCDVPLAAFAPAADAQRHGSIGTAIHDWQWLLGSENVQFDRVTLDRYSRSTLPQSTRPLAVLRPSSVGEVSEVVKIAARYRLSLYPISRGRNWGYGDACAPTNGQVVVDLGRMDRIVEVHEELAYAVIEPGVTQGQLFEYLKSQGLSLMVPVHGGGPDCSLIGNALERGYGITPIADHFAALTSIEAVLPDGSLYRSPLAELGGDQTSRLFKWGVGPYVDGLFSQGNFGIVTQASILLAPRPAHTEAFFFTFDDPRLPGVVDAVRNLLRTLGAACSSINLMNDRRVMAMTVPFPHDRVVSEEAMPQGLVRDIAAKEGIAPWTGAGALYGDPAMVKQARKIVKRHLARYTSKLVCVSPAQEQRWRRWARLLPSFGSNLVTKRLDAVASFLRIAQGEPQRIALTLPYWKRKQNDERPRTHNPGADGCGLIWYSPLVPLAGESVVSYCRMVEQVSTEHGHDPLITLTTLGERLIDSTVPILFDPNSSDGCRQARGCYQALMAHGKTLGFLPYRYPMSSPPQTGADVALRLARRVKSVFDPAGTIAPRRYA